MQVAEIAKNPEALVNQFLQYYTFHIFIARNILTRNIDIANLSICPTVCLSVCPSVTFRYQMKTA